MNKFGTTIYWAIVYCSLAVLLQYGYRYYFFYTEQLQLFLFSGGYAADTVLQPGGPALYIARFIVQFYSLPFVGALTTALMLTLICVLTKRLSDTTAKSPANYLLSILPACLLIFAHTDINYNVQGTIACLMMLAAMMLYIKIQSFKLRLAVGGLMIPVLFFAAGAAVSLFALLGMLFEVMSKNRRWYSAAIYFLEVAAAGFVSLYLGWQGELRLIILPDAYYEPLLNDKVIYYVWAAFPAAWVLALFFKRNKLLNKHTKVIIALQMVSYCALLVSDNRMMIFKSMEQDYYLRRGQWDRIIETFTAEKSNTQMTNVLSLALAQKGLLGDRLFAYHPQGRKSVLAEWDNTQTNAIALCDIYFGIGDIATAQKFALEGMISSLNGGNVRLLQRLVETNLIYGEYAVAKKYIELLEQTLFYRTKGHEYRKFLYDDKAIAKDSLLGGKRKALSNGNRYAVSNNPLQTFEQLANNNPAAPLPMQYLLALCLTNRDLKTFRTLITKYHRTKMLPTLSTSHQEAVIALEQDNPTFWIKNGVTSKVEQRFRAFDADVRQRNIANFDGRMRQSHGETYWYYLLFNEGRR
jgi:hypothetical protein